MSHAEPDFAKLALEQELMAALSEKIALRMQIERLKAELVAARLQRDRSGKDHA